MPALTLALANRIISASLAKARSDGLKPLTIAVLDPGGHLIALQREDGSSNLRPAIAVAKANGALGLGISSRAIGAIAVERPTFLASLHALAPSGLVPAAGGVIVQTLDGALCGAVGVTGDSSDHDELCALAGIAEAGLIAQP